MTDRVPGAVPQGVRGARERLERGTAWAQEDATPGSRHALDAARDRCTGFKGVTGDAMYAINLVGYVCRQGLLQ